MLKNSIDKIVNDKLDGIEVTPPAYVWNSINQRMLENKQRRRVLYYWQSAAAIALVLLSVGVIFFMSDRGVGTKQIAGVDKQDIVKSVEEVEKVTANEPVNNTVIQHEDVAEVVSNVDSDKATKRKRATHGSFTKNKLKTAETTIEKNVISFNQTKVEQGSVIAEEKSIVKMNYLSASTIEEEVPVVKLLLPEKSIAKSPVLYAYSVVKPEYRPKAKRYHFVVGGSASPTYNYRSVGESQNSSVVRRAYDSPTNESGIISVSGGVNVRMEGKSRWSFETGVLFSQVGQEVSQVTTYSSISGVSGISGFVNANSANLVNTSINSVSKFSNTMGNINFNNNTSIGVEQNLLKSGVYLESYVNAVDNKSESATLKQLLDYIEVPLMVRYSVFNKKPVITLAGGFSTNFLVDNNVYVIDNGEHINAGETEGINGVTYSSTVGIGLELPLGKSIRFSLEPRFKYYLSPVNSKGYNSFRPYSFGVFGGISFILNNH